MDRIDPDTTGDERSLLVAFLASQRATLLGKCQGLDRGQLTTTTAASSLHLAGLLKHLAFVEHWWFHEVFLDDPEHPVFAQVDWDADRDWEFRTAADDDPDWLRQLYRDACASSDEVIAGADLDQRSARSVHGGQPSLRWVLLHMIEETARHAGHADLIREAIDGVTGG